MGLLSDVKNKVIECAALSYLNNKLLAPYGRATSLKVDAQARTLRLSLELKGETAPVELEIADYEIIKEHGRYFAVVKTVRVSRKWLTALAQDQLCNRRFELSAKAGGLLMKLM